VALGNLTLWGLPVSIIDTGVFLVVPIKSRAISTVPVLLGVRLSSTRTSARGDVFVRSNKYRGGLRHRFA